MFCFVFLPFIFCRRRKWHGATDTAKSLEKSCYLAPHRNTSIWQRTRPVSKYRSRVCVRVLSRRGTEFIFRVFSYTAGSEQVLSLVCTGAPCGNLPLKTTWGWHAARRGGEALLRTNRWRISTGGAQHPKQSANAAVCNTDRARSSSWCDHLLWFARCWGSFGKLPITHTSQHLYKLEVIRHQTSPNLTGNQKNFLFNLSRLCVLVGETPASWDFPCDPGEIVHHEYLFSLCVSWTRFKRQKSNPGSPISG